MNIVIYLTCVLLALHCLDKGISMNYGSTRKTLICSYVIFFGGLVGIATWTSQYGANLVIALLLTGMAGIFLFDRRQASRKRYAR